MSPNTTQLAPVHQGKPVIPAPGTYLSAPRLADPSQFSDHPLLAGIPTWRRDEPEFQSLVESIREHGQDYEVLVDQEDRIVDGRNRRNACAVLKQPVRVRTVPKDEAASIIVASLVNRRHLTKGALAYLSAPLFSNVLEESKTRNLAMLKAGGASVPYSVGSAHKTAEDVAAHVGVSTALFEQALKLRRMFDEMEGEVRSKYEPRVLGDWLDEAGDWQAPVGLGYMINGLTSMLTEANGRKKDLGKRAQHDRLFIGFLPKLKSHWSSASAEQKAQIAERLKVEVTKFPAELREEMAAALRAAARADRE